MELGLLRLLHSHVAGGRHSEKAIATPLSRRTGLGESLLRCHDVAPAPMSASQRQGSHAAHVVPRWQESKGPLGHFQGTRYLLVGEGVVRPDSGGATGHELPFGSLLTRGWQRRAR